MINFNKKLLSIVLIGFWFLGGVSMGHIVRYQSTNGSLHIPPEATPDDSQFHDHYYVLECDHKNRSVTVYDAWYDVSNTDGLSQEVSQNTEDETVANFTNRDLKFFNGDGSGLIDTRQLVPDTESFPWNSIGLIRVYNIIGEYVNACTGALIAPRVVLTAASCIYDLNNDDFYDIITFAPGETYIDEPYGVYNGDQSAIKTAYTLGFKSYDFGLILLEDAPPVRQYMSFGYDCSDSTMTLNIAGYPWDLSLLVISLDMFYASCEETGIDMCPIGDDLQDLYHFCDATIGMEGAPMWTYNTLTGERTIRAVHYGGDILTNDAALLTPFVTSYINDKLSDWGQS